MITYRNARYAGVLVAVLSAVGCGAGRENLRNTGNKGNGDSTPTAATDPAATDPGAAGKAPAAAEADGGLA
jgi:hypothetical protein